MAKIINGNLEKGKLKLGKPTWTTKSPDPEEIIEVSFLTKLKYIDEITFPNLGQIENLKIESRRMKIDSGL